MLAIEPRVHARRCSTGQSRSPPQPDVGRRGRHRLLPNATPPCQETTPGPFSASSAAPIPGKALSGSPVAVLLSRSGAGAAAQTSIIVPCWLRDEPSESKPITSTASRLAHRI